MLITQEPKYEAKNNKIINRATGEPIPDDEPIFILRGKDDFAIDALLAYLQRIRLGGCDDEHILAVVNRLKDFYRFVLDKSSRFEIQDTELGK